MDFREYLTFFLQDDKKNARIHLVIYTPCMRNERILRCIIHYQVELYQSIDPISCWEHDNECFTWPVSIIVRTRNVSLSPN